MCVMGGRRTGSRSKRKESREENPRRCEGLIADPNIWIRLWTRIKDDLPSCFCHMSPTHSTLPQKSILPSEWKIAQVKQKRGCGNCSHAAWRS